MPTYEDILQQIALQDALTQRAVAAGPDQGPAGVVTGVGALAAGLGDFGMAFKKAGLMRDMQAAAKQQEAMGLERSRQELDIGKLQQQAADLALKNAQEVRESDLATQYVRGSSIDALRRGTDAFFPLDAAEKAGVIYDTSQVPITDTGGGTYQKPMARGLRFGQVPEFQEAIQRNPVYLASFKDRITDRGAQEEFRQAEQKADAELSHFKLNMTLAREQRKIDPNTHWNAIVTSLKDVQNNLLEFEKLANPVGGMEQFLGGLQMSGGAGGGMMGGIKPHQVTPAVQAAFALHMRANIDAVRASLAAFSQNNPRDVRTIKFTDPILKNLDQIKIPDLLKAPDEQDGEKGIQERAAAQDYLTGLLRNVGMAEDVPAKGEGFVNPESAVRTKQPGIRPPFVATDTAAQGAPPRQLVERYKEIKAKNPKMTKNEIIAMIKSEDQTRGKGQNAFLLGLGKM